MCIHLFKYQNLFYFSVYKFNVWPPPHCLLLLIFSFTATAASSLHAFCPRIQLIWVLSSNSQPTIQLERTDTTSCFITTMQTSFVCFVSFRFETRLVRKSRVQLNEFRIDPASERPSVEWKTKQKQNGQNYHEMISCPVVYVRKHIFSSSSSFLLGKRTNKIFTFFSR